MIFKFGIQEKENQSFELTNKGSFGNLLDLGKTMMCNVSYDQMESKRTVYTANRKARGDFTVKTTENQTADSHMIIDEMYMYSWS